MAIVSILSELVTDLLPTSLSSKLLLLSCCLFTFFVGRRILGAGRVCPPGPRGFPLLGIFPLMGASPHRTFSRWARQYGPVMNLPFGRRNLIMLNDYQTVMETFNKNVFAGRGSNFINDYILKKEGLIATEGEVWHKERHFAFSVLHELGMGKLSFEEHVHREIDHVVETIRRTCGQPFDLKPILSSFTSNIVTYLLYGSECGITEDDKAKIGVLTADMLKLMEEVTFVEFVFPWLKYLPGDLFNFKKAVAASVQIEDLIRDEVKRHLADFNPDNLRGYVDAYYKNLNVEDIEQISGSHLVSSTRDLYTAGIDTSAVGLQWTILFLLNDVQLQDKLHQVIIKQIGKDGKVSMLDKSSLALVLATLHESSRRASIVPIGDIHVPLQDAYIKDYLIEKKTMIAANVWHIHHDPQVWKDPMKFDPYRFIDNNGALTNTKQLIPFLVGKRSCIGEALANTEMFLMFATLLQKFTFVPENDNVLPDYEGEFGNVLKPKNFKVRAKERM